MAERMALKMAAWTGATWGNLLVAVMVVWLVAVWENEMDLTKVGRWVGVKGWRTEWRWVATKAASAVEMMVVTSAAPLGTRQAASMAAGNQCEIMFSSNKVVSSVIYLDRRCR